MDGLVVSAPSLDAVPSLIPNRIGGRSQPARSGDRLEKLDPHSGAPIWSYPRSSSEDIEEAVGAAKQAQLAWAGTPPVKRGEVLYAICNHLEQSADLVASIVRAETGKSFSEAKAEVGAAVGCGRFFAGEGQRLYGRTTTSGIPGRYAMTVRQPVGVAGLIIAANTPIANVAWKVFPALICGNAAVLKTPEDTPATAWIFGKIAEEAGLPSGVLSIVHGLGREAGAPLVAHPEVGVVSFTGSTAVGKEIARVGGGRLAKVSLELGGKNPFVVCEDADLDSAVRWAILSAFSNAGQRCASGSRIIVLESIYDRFVDALVHATESLKLGPGDDDDLGPVINQRAVDRILGAMDRAVKAGAKVLTGGYRIEDEDHRAGFYVAPSLITDVPPEESVIQEEIFGPLSVVTSAPDYGAALKEANSSKYGLTACIHTRDWDRALHFVMNVRAGVGVVNLGTHGSEPHMPFGGVGISGNGSREPGTEALDVYTELKDLYLSLSPSAP